MQVSPGLVAMGIASVMQSNVLIRTSMNDYEIG